MLFEFTTAGHVLGAEDGVLRAQDVKRLCQLSELDSQVRSERERLLREATEAANAMRLLAEEESALLLALAREKADPDAIRADAQTQAAQLLAQAREDAERMRQEALLAGREEGALQAAQEWHERRLALARHQERSMTEVQDKIIQIVMSAVQRIIEPESKEALFRQAAKNVQHLFKAASQMTLRVALSDLDAARATFSVPGVSRWSEAIDIVVDAGLAPGAAIFESTLGTLNASLDVQLDSLKCALLGTRLEQGSSHDESQ